MQPEQQPPVNPSEQPQPNVEPQTQQQPYAQPEPVATPEPAAQQPVAPQLDQFAQSATPFQSPEQPVAPQRPAEDPGKLFNILGIVGAFIGFQLPGLILSILGRKKSKKAGYPTTLGTVGIVLNAVFMVITLGVLALLTLVAYQGVQSRALDTNTMTTANNILKKVEVYASENAAYPTFEQLHSATGAAQLADDDKAALKDTKTPKAKEVGYITCSDATGTVTGVSVYVYSESEGQVSQFTSTGECEDGSEL